MSATRPKVGWFDRLLDLLALKPRDTAREELEEALAEADEASFSARERTMLRNILGLHERRIADVMVHRADIIAVEDDRLHAAVGRAKCDRVPRPACSRPDRLVGPGFRTKSASALTALPRP